MLYDYLEPGWSPWNELKRLQREMNNLFSGSQNVSNEYPAVNLWSDEQSLILTTMVPGIKPEDLNITVQGNQLTLEGEIKEEKYDDKVVFYRRERGAGRFVRSMRLPYEVEGDNSSAKYQNGILILTMPRAEKSKPKKIKIN